MASGSNHFGESRTQVPAVIDLGWWGGSRGMGDAWGAGVKRRAQSSMCGPFLQGQDM